MTNIDPKLVDQHLDAILRASGSALRHYTMAKHLEDMRQAVRAAMAAAPQPCTCPSPDGSLRWPRPQHPPEPAAESTWVQATSLAELDAVREALEAFASDQTGDNAVGIVSSVLDSVRQAPQPASECKANCPGEGCTCEVAERDQG